MKTVVDDLHELLASYTEPCVGDCDHSQCPLLRKLHALRIKATLEQARLTVKPIVDREKKGEEIGDLMNMRLDAGTTSPAAPKEEATLNAPECNCEHDNENCCAVAGKFCAQCWAYVALRKHRVTSASPATPNSNADSAMPRRYCSVHKREEFKYESLEHELHAAEECMREQIVQAITDIQEARESHVRWAAHLRNEKYALCEGCDNFAAHIGDAEYHDEWIAKYDNVIAVLARTPFATTSSPDAADAAREAALEISEWLRTGDGEVDANAINEVTAIIRSHCFPTGGKSRKEIE